MPVNVLAFGKIAEIINQPQIQLEANDLDDLKQKLQAQFPALAEQKFSTAVNKKLIHENHKLAAGDEVALLPPFSGG